MNYKEYIKSKEYVSSYEKHIQSIKDSRRVRKYNDISDFFTISTDVIIERYGGIYSVKVFI